MLLVATMLLCSIKLFEGRRSVTPLYLSAVTCLIAALLLGVFTKYFTYPIIGAAVGLFVKNSITQRAPWGTFRTRKTG